jgi:hypothetical protein
VKFRFFLTLIILIAPNAIRRHTDRRYRLTARRRSQFGIRRHSPHQENFI